jgi:hypothetical protein
MSTKKPPLQKKPVTKKVAGKSAAKAVAGSSGVRVQKAASPTRNAEVLVLDDYEREIQKFYSMSKKRAVEAAKKAGVLTPSGRLSGAYK